MADERGLTTAAVNVVVVVGSASINAELTKRFVSEKTSLGEPIQVVALDRSDGVAEQDESFTEHSREQIIKEYFFGGARRSLSPQIQQVDFDSLVIYKAPEGASPAPTRHGLLFAHPSLLVRRGARAGSLLGARRAKLCHATLDAGCHARIDEGRARGGADG